MNIRTFLPPELPGFIPPFFAFQKECIEDGAGPYLYATQIEDLERAGIRLYMVFDENDNAIAAAYTRRTAPQTAQLSAFSVAQRWQNQTIGTQLGRYIIRTEAELGVARIELVVRIDADGNINDPAAKLYRKLGFVKTGVTKTFEITADPRVRHLAGSADADGRFRSAEFILDIGHNVERRHD